MTQIAAPLSLSNAQLKKKLSIFPNSQEIQVTRSVPISEAAAQKSSCGDHQLD